MSTNTAVTVRPQAPIQAQQAQAQNVPVLDFSAVPAHVMARAAQIAADVMAQEGGKINPAQALSAAYHFENTGEVYGRHSYVGTKGNVAGRVLEGYRAVARELDMSRYQWRYRPLTADEEKMVGLQAGDRALICELDVLAARRQCIEMGIEYYPVIGCTVIRKNETFNVPKNRFSLWVLQKQARNDAFRQVGENTEADEVLAEAGITDAPEGYMSVEQAEAMVRERLTEIIRAAQQPTPQELQARAADNAATMRAPKDFQGFGDEPEPGGTADHAPLEAPKPNGNGHVPDATEPTAARLVDGLVNADTERAAAAIRARIVGNIPTDGTKAHTDIVTKLQGGLHIAVPNEDERHALTAYMLGSSDSTTWTQGAVMAMRTWLGIGKVGDGYAPSAKFLDDWKVIKAAIMPTVEIVGA